MGKVYDPDPTDWEFVDAANDNKEAYVCVDDSLRADDAIHITVSTADPFKARAVHVHVPFERAEEIALDILARLKDRGFYGNL